MAPRSQKSPKAKKRRAAYWVVSTHWDREWYEPFQDFRYRLVGLLDEVTIWSYALTREEILRVKHARMDHPDSQLMVGFNGLR